MLSSAVRGDKRRMRGAGPSVPDPISDVGPRGTIRVRDAFARRALATADIAAAAGAYMLAVVVAAGGEARWEALLALPLVVVANKVAGLYDRDDLLIYKATSLDEMPALFNVATLATLLMALGGNAVADGDLTPLPLLVLWLSLTLLLVIFRAGARAFALRQTATERCVVIGDADASAQLASKLDDSPHINSEVIGYVPLRDRIRSDDPSPLGALEELGDLLDDHDIHRVIVAPRDTDSDAHLNVVRTVKALGVKLSVLPRILEVVGSSSEFDDLDGLMVLGVRRFGLTRSSRVTKRALDVVGATAMLLLAAPFMLAIMAAIRLDSAGPPFFRQKRVGRDDQVFEIVKFRTMAADAEARKQELLADNETEGLFKMRDDPRVTRVGRLLRRSSLDELPQLLNVLQGHMSLVGPRPLVLDEDRRIVGWHRRRLQLKPGMTGPWQILGSGRIPLYEMVKIDYLYVANWSMWSDLKLLIRTIPYVLARRGL